MTGALHEFVLIKIKNKKKLLKNLEESGLGLSVNEFYAGGFTHAEYNRL